MNQNLGLYSTITSDYIVAGVKSQLNLREDSSWDLKFADDVNLGLQQLRNCFSFIPATTVLPILQHKVELPDGFIRLYTSNPTYSSYTFVNSDGSPVTTVDVSGVIITPGTNFDPQVIDGWMLFPTWITAQWVRIFFLSANLDANGDIKIPAIAEIALRSFVCQYYYEAQQNFNAAAVYERRFGRYKAWLTGVFATPDAIENRQLIRMQNQLY